MRIEISISVAVTQFNEVAKRELVIEVPDESPNLFSQVAIGAMVEEHVVSAVEEYARKTVRPEKQAIAVFETEKAIKLDVVVSEVEGEGGNF